MSSTQNIFYLHSYEMLTTDADEIRAARKVFGDSNAGTDITKIPVGSLVIPRYRALPFGRELEEEIASLGSTLINTYRQHRNIANLFAWSHLLEGITAPAYRVDEIPYLPEGSYFVKGETNSVKNAWFDKAFAQSKSDLPRIIGNLSNDMVVGSQDIVIRPFQKFRQLATAVDGRPVFHERRVFTLDGIVLSSAFYWTSFPEVADTLPKIAGNFEKTLTEALKRIEGLSRFVVIDLGEMENGEWQVVELNDGPMSGLSDNDDEVVWSNFKKVVESSNN